MKFLSLAVSGALIICATAVAQDATGDTAQKGQLSASDTSFMRDLAQGGMAEVQAGKLAAEKATGASVKQFGRRMVKDHTKNDQQLEHLAQTKGVALPTTPDAEQQAQKTRLESENGANFDAAYIKAQVQDHQKTVELLEHEISNGQDPAVRKFAKGTLPVVQHHLAMATRLEDTVPNNRSTASH